MSLDYIEKLPKVELHAHLHGSIRLDMLSKLALVRDPNNSHNAAGASESDIRERINRLLVSGNVYKNGGNVHKTLNECFEIFDLIHDVVVDTESLRFCLREVILDFLKDNVRYLELRTTPRKTAFMNEKEYLETVLDTIAKCETEERLPIMVRILVSVNRALGVDAARANVELACKYHKMTGIVVGIDFSGNPTKGVFSDFVPILLQARNQGLKITVHCAEVDDPQEVKQIITDFRPDRLGHMLFVSKELQEYMFNMNPPVPIECCPTSNCITLGLGTAGIKTHPYLNDWLLHAHPLCICTDDSGVFDTSLSLEMNQVRYMK
mmetsp:Transcript_386/g.490  ORF Transcript_386/g.490 Transcript_386/m.490 type:complete len:322 (+) Transcript_386:233-1198(+)